LSSFGVIASHNVTPIVGLGLNVPVAFRPSRASRIPSPPLPIERPHLHANFGEDW
jgi:hypothetical protein